MGIRDRATEAGPTSFRRTCSQQMIGASSKYYNISESLLTFLYQIWFLLNPGHASCNQLHAVTDSLFDDFLWLTVRQLLELEIISCSHKRRHDDGFLFQGLLKKCSRTFGQKIAWWAEVFKPSSAVGLFWQGSPMFVFWRLSVSIAQHWCIVLSLWHICSMCVCMWLAGFALKEWIHGGVIGIAFNHSCWADCQFIICWSSDHWLKSRSHL